ncbi:endonuclease/exonuclease/phosphatase family protein [bacterium]|nr:endonuclease/exonuclease/phosphatase family protein [bacterium]
MIQRSMVRSFFLVLQFFLLQCTLSSRTDMTVMTFNILYNSHRVPSGERSWESRRPVMMDVLKKHTPDLMGTQEGLKFQTKAIKEAFANWEEFGHGVYHNILALNPRRPYEDLDGCSCRIFYDDRKFVLLDQGTFWQSDTPDSVGSRTWGNELPRIVTWGTFQVKKGGKKFVVLNTHFHVGQPYLDNATRLLMEKWRKIAGDLPTILMGDFNSEPEWPVHEVFCGRSGPENLRGRFRDCWQMLGKSETDAGTCHHFDGKPLQRIDWILVTPEFEVKSMDIIHDHVGNCYPSDHFPVMAKLSL